MVNPSRIVGTRAESAVVKVARDNGFPMAMRLPLSGRLDRGDILLNPGSGDPLYLEVKAGDKAKKASDNQIIKWLDEHMVALKQAPGATGFLVVPRERRSPGFWWAIRYEGTRVVYEWLEQALKDESEYLSGLAALDALEAGDPKVQHDPEWANPSGAPYGGYFLDRAIQREAEASVKLDGETFVVGEPWYTMPDPYDPDDIESN